MISPMTKFALGGLLLLSSVSSFTLLPQHPHTPSFLIQSSTRNFNFPSSSSSPSSSTMQRKMGSSDNEGLTPPPPPSAMEQLESIKNSLVRECETKSPNKDKILRLVKELEDMGEQVGVGQASSHSGLLAGEWSLLYASEDVTRSSPFFWAFRKTFPDNAEQIFSITDAIPAPIKEVGPATQTISLTDNTLVSRVKVATLGGVATSIMTTRCKITSRQGLDSIVVQVDTTKPEKSTVLEKLGPLGAFVQENSKAFPSGQALEKVREGGSYVMIETPFCDEGIRISKDGELNNGEIYIWVRSSFEDESEV